LIGRVMLVAAIFKSPFDAQCKIRVLKLKAAEKSCLTSAPAPLRDDGPHEYCTTEINVLS